MSISRTVLELVRREGRGVLLDDAVADPEMQRAAQRGPPRLALGDGGAGAGRSARCGGSCTSIAPGPGLFDGEDLALLAAMAAVIGLSERLLRGLHPAGAMATGARPPAPVDRGRQARPAPGDPANQGGPAWAASGGHDAQADLESGGLVGDAPAFREALRLLAAAARVDTSVLITGESGTGKEELARALHARSRRARGPFVAVNCGAIPESLAESALFGHQKGAFTGAAFTQQGYFEAADGGTLLLDEVGELAPAIQAKLLRTLQERLFFRLGSSTPRRTDVRVVAATHRDLRREVAAGRFREDLTSASTSCPSACRPCASAPATSGPWPGRCSTGRPPACGRPSPSLAPTAEPALARWRWPGNARELGNVLERLLVMRDPGDDAPIDGDEVAAALGREPPTPRATIDAGDDAPLAGRSPPSSAGRSRPPCAAPAASRARPPAPWASAAPPSTRKSPTSQSICGPTAARSGIARRCLFALSPRPSAAVGRG